MSLMEAFHYKVVQHVLICRSISALRQILQIICKLIGSFVSASGARAALRGVPLLAQEGRICVRGALPRRYNYPVDPWSCRLADSLLDPSMTLPSVLRVHPLSNLGGTRWSRIGLSKVGIALI